MAQAKKERKERESKVTEAEAKLVSELETLSKNKNPTDAQKERKATLRKQIAPLRFVRLAQQRVPRAVKAVQSVGKLTGSGYAHTEEQAIKIMKLLDAAVESVRNKLTGAEVEGEKFSL